MLTYEIHPILCDDIHCIDSQPFKVAKTTKCDFCDQIIYLVYIVIWYTYFIYDNFAKLSLHDCNEFIFVKHSKNSLYNCWIVYSI
jgi:hypothetical protein